MKSLSTGLMATLMAVGLAASLAGCPPAEECSTNADCESGQVCNDDSECVTPSDPCLDVTCPGAQTCNAQSGACEGACCTTSACTNPRETCDETACLENAADICVDKTCGEGANLGCPTGFSCNQIDEVCEAGCLPEHQGCADPSEICNPESGECELRLPEAGEVGTACGATSDCGTGLTCFSEAQYGINDGYCTKRCNSDAECPQGSFCDGVCLDACTVDYADCAVDRQCVDDGNVEYCWPIFDQSECTTDCLPNGSPCDPAVENQCAAGSGCVDYGDVAFCQILSCHVFDVGCEAGQTCEGLGSGLTACFSNCDASDPLACSELDTDTANVTCLPNTAIVGPDDAVRLVSAVENCNAAEASMAFTISGESLAACYKECVVDTDCAAGQLCRETTLAFQSGDTLSVTTCMNYDFVEGACADGICGDATCAEFQDTSGTIGICHKGCATDADCTDGYAGTCLRLFSDDSGAEALACLYMNDGSICLSGCDTNADCGYCETDADCGTDSGGDGTTRAQLCDFASHTCKTPINGPAEVNNWCYTGEALNAQGIQLENGTYRSSCAGTCDDSADCFSGECDANGFCTEPTEVCNAATHQCEETCAPANEALDCLYGSCAAGAGPLGEDICVLDCEADQTCLTGVCDTGAAYCVLSCNEAGCAEGFECNAESGLCTAVDTVPGVTVTVDPTTLDIASGGTVTIDVDTTNDAVDLIVTADYLDAAGALVGTATIVCDTTDGNPNNDPAPDALATNGTSTCTHVVAVADIPAGAAELQYTADVVDADADANSAVATVTLQ